MSQQIVFFKKNRADFGYANVSATSSEGSTYAGNVLDRKNTTLWQTTGSADANNTTLTIDFGQSLAITDILLLNHNFKAYTVKYWNGSAYTNFSTPISKSGNTATTTFHQFTEVSAQFVQVTITGTMVANADKYLAQFIATERLGQLASWPVIKAPMNSRNRIINKMLSGKVNVVENVGGFACSLTVASLTSDADLTVIETLYGENEGFLTWLCGGDQTQFKTVRQGYQLQDVFLMKCINEYQPEYYKGLYGCGIVLQMNLQEVID